MATALEDKKIVDKVEDEGTTSCASGCELSLAAGVISMAAAAVVFLLRKYESAPAGDDISDDTKPSAMSAAGRSQSSRASVA